MQKARIKVGKMYEFCFRFIFFIFFKSHIFFLCFSTGSLSLPVFNHLLHGPDAVYHHESLPDAKVLATTVSTFTRWFAKDDQFIQFPSEVDMGVTKKMLKRLGLNREPNPSSWTRNEL